MTTLPEHVEIIEKADRCKFSTYGYACGKHVEHGRYLCEEHATAKCASCGQPATHGCDFCGQFVCGTPLCDECTFGTDTTKPAGAWGFMNHVHISKPEFADKHENRRLKEENAALARNAEALRREIAELRKLLGGDHEVKPLSEERLDEILEFEEQFKTLGGAGDTASLDWATQRALIDEAVLACRARTLLNGGSDAQG